MRTRSQLSLSSYGSSSRETYLFSTWEKRYGVWFRRQLTAKEYAIEQAIRKVVDFTRTGKKYLDATHKHGMRAAEDAAAHATRAAQTVATHATPVLKRAAKASGSYALAGLSAATARAAHETERLRRNYDEWMYPKPVPGWLERLIPERLMTFLRATAVGTALGLSALVVVAAVVALRDQTSLRRTVLSMLGLDAREQSRALHFVEDATRDGRPTGPVAVSVRGHPSVTCVVSLYDATMAMRAQQLNVDLSSADSLRVKISPELARANGCSLVPRLK